MSASFLEMRFPTGIAYGAVGGPSYNTSIVQFQNGRESRNQQWSQGLGVWDVSHGVKTQAEVDQLVAFFRSVKGRAYGFRFKDWSDHTATQCLMGVGDGSNGRFQLCKQYISYDIYGNPIAGEVKTIYKPVPGTVTVYSGVTIANAANMVALEPTQYGIDYTTGVLNCAGQPNVPASGIGMWVSCEFDIPVRFDTDQMKVTLEDYNTYSWGSVLIKEILPY